jgi:Trm5-related predicted tRNA methylase
MDLNITQFYTELINEKLELQIKNALNIVKRAIFKEIIELTLLKKFAVVPLNP